MTLFRLSWLSILCLVCWNPIHAQPLTPTTVSIPMRDGKVLAADVYLPGTCTQCPTILIQTPYNKNTFHNWLPLGVGLNIANSHYAFVVVDWRGFYGSASAAISSPNRGEDGYDVIAWISQQSWSDGKVGTWGPSALGKVQYETAREQHPAHICAVPQVASPIFAYDDFYYGGVLEESQLEQLDALGYGLSTFVTANQVKNFLWNSAASSSTYPADISIPMLMQGGWYDHASRQMLEYFNLLQASSPAAADIYLLIGPWVHGGTGAAYVGSSNQGALSYPGAAGWSDSLAMQFFDYHLRSQTTNGWPMPQQIRFFQMGDTWADSDVFPASGISPHTYYLAPGGTLSPVAPVAASAFDQLTGDPRDPSPTIGGATLHPTLQQGPYDQAPAVESRAGVLTYTSVAFGLPVVLQGQVKVHFWLTSDRKDTDLAVRLTDVYPDGRSMLITDGIHRARFRDGFAAGDTSVLTPGVPAEMTVTLPPTAYTFMPGHKLRIDVTTSHSRRWDINLNTGGAMLTAGDTLVVTNHILRQASNASWIELPVMDLIGSVQESGAPALQVFPNPSNGSFSVMLPAGYEPGGTLVVYNMHGAEVWRGPANSNPIQINLSLPTGAYLLALQHPSATVYHKLLIHD
jgi:hypothetical protein